MQPLTSDNTIPLTQVAPGQAARFVEISAGRSLTHRLAEMGMTPGVEMEVLQNHGGPLLLIVRGTRLALGRGMASKIMVRRV